MLISHRHKFIYLKTVKTAGTSVEATLDQFCVPEDHPRARKAKHLTEQIVTGSGIIGARGRRHKAGADWYNHMPAKEVRRKIGNQVWNDYFKFCNIRNPWDRNVSLFHFQVPEAKEMEMDQVFELFRRWIRIENNSHSDFFIYSINKFPVMDDYINYDTLQRDFNRIGERLGLPDSNLLELKTGFRGAEKIPYQDYFDVDTRDVVAKTCSREIEIFGWKLYQ